MTRGRRQSGFTLVEAIVVIVITGIVAGTVAVFIRPAMDAYTDSTRRAALTDEADTAARRIARDLQAALPNSVRILDAAGTQLVFIPVHDAGRYRAEIGDTAAPGNPLDFTVVDTAFDVLGPPVTVNKGDSLVVYNLGIPGADAYDWPLTNRRVALTGGNTVTIASADVLRFPSPGQRFQIVGAPIGYECADGTVRRYVANGFPTTGMTFADLFPGITPDVLVSHVTACNFADTVGALQHNGLVSIRLTLTRGDESVTLLHQVNVDNVP
ncbi:prepilin-type N-terminal cleavage/methylation domain-containing protein [Propionivibrio soli]|uniref:prepilin-type N-terminal cleavage/methylation domain-containing protein n=1 Tax=Propionivibrio soli TaxID=2976531 RepID=UPI0021E75183|nr:prepilin-type N-terminal cleavage/methylation domain-containing protein [Propionivibrio soli]